MKPHERPLLPGSPATPDHPPALRAAYAVIGLLVSVTASLGAAFISANQANLQGALGVGPAEVAWIPVVFVMTNACMNLLLIKFRQQYGLRLFTEIFLTALVVLSAAHLFFTGFGSMLATRAVAGMAAAGLSTLGVFYLLQAFPSAHRLKGLVIGISMATLTAPIARLMSTEVLDLGDWKAFYLLELGLALICLACVFALPLPPSQRVKAFRPLDFLTFALFAPGVALLTASLGLGRVLWWTQAAWIGWALAGSIVLIAAALIIEHNRTHPLIDTSWLTGGDMIRLALSIFLVRVVLSEQTAGAVGFLTAMGVHPDQLHGLFTVIFFATVGGVATAAFTLNMDKLQKPIIVALALIAVGAYLDSHATPLTRPRDLFFSQALISFAAALFLGPALLTGFANLLKRGPHLVISFFVMFSIVQNVGGLAGSALVGSLETVRQRAHFARLVQDVDLADPLAAGRLQQLATAQGRVLLDPALRENQGVILLYQQLTQQAHVLAYNDVFLTIAAVAALTCAWVSFNYLRARRRARAAARAAATA
nr:MFS transporter [Caulobacter sp. 17J80-11]